MTEIQYDLYGAFNKNKNLNFFSIITSYYQGEVKIIFEIDFYFDFDDSIFNFLINSFNQKVFIKISF